MSSPIVGPRMLIAWLDDPACQVVELAGGKAASLSRLAAAHPVPPGFCVTTQAYARWVEAAEPAHVPSEVGAALATAYSALAQQCGSSSLRVAVRSSAVGEDGHAASFAGQYTTYLNVSGAEVVAGAVGRCWASARAERVRVYQQRQAPAPSAAGVAVLVQRMVAADVAFVAFSAHPVTGERDEVVINANWGLGESIVDGAVIPDTYVVRKRDWSITTQTIGEKQHMTVLRPAGVENVKVPRGLRQQPTLSPSQAKSIATLAARLETEMGWPVDIEGALKDGDISLLQCRPISSL